MSSPKNSLQGNFDPAQLIEANGKTVETVRASARQLLQAFGPQRLIANLGKGLGGKESPALVEAFVNAIHEESAAMIAATSETSKALSTTASGTSATEKATTDTDPASLAFKLVGKAKNSRSQWCIEPQGEELNTIFDSFEFM